MNDLLLCVAQLCKKICFSMHSTLLYFLVLLKVMWLIKFLMKADKKFMHVLKIILGTKKAFKKL